MTAAAPASCSPSTTSCPRCTTSPGCCAASAAVAHVDASASGEDALGQAGDGAATTACSSTCACPASTASSWRASCAGSATRPAVVFVSAYENAAVEAFELHVLDYLVKPVSRQRIEEAIRRVAAETGRRPRRTPRARDGAERGCRA